MVPGLPQLQALVERFITVSVALAFLALTVIIIVSGIKILTSGGDAKAVGAARNAITWAVAGIAFMLLAWIIILLIEALTGAELTQFNLAFPSPQ